MSDTGSQWTERWRLASASIAAANLVAVATSAGWETVAVHLLLVAGGVVFAARPPRTISPRDAAGFGLALTLATVGNELLEGREPVNDVDEAWLVCLLVVGLSWLAVRRARVAGELKSSLDERERLFRRQERLMYDLAHELRAPATSARLHLQPLRSADETASAAAEVALDELTRIDRIVERLLLLGRGGRAQLVEVGEIETEELLEDVLLRWSGIAERSWRLGAAPPGLLRADPDAVRIALDALLEDAVKQTGVGYAIELRAEADGDSLVIEVEDSRTAGALLDAAGTILARPAPAGQLGSEDDGDGEGGAGAGIGLELVEAIALAHGGSWTFNASPRGSIFSLRLPGFRSVEELAASLEP